jgi:hypothetical protein
MMQLRSGLVAASYLVTFAFTNLCQKSDEELIVL